MGSKQFNFWVDKIKKDGAQVAQELHEAYKNISTETFYKIWVDKHIKGLHALIAQNKEINSYTLAQAYIN